MESYRIVSLISHFPSYNAIVVLWGICRHDALSTLGLVEKKVRVMIKSKTYFVVSMIFAICMVGAEAYAKEKPYNRLDEAGISLVEAIEIAENHQSGRAYEAELESNRFHLEYEVKITDGEKRYKVSIDGLTGKVKKVRERK